MKNRRNVLEEDILAYRIFGDNLDECIKVAKLIEETASFAGLELIDIYRNFFTPTFCFRANQQLKDLAGKILAFQVCGRYEEWAGDHQPIIGYEAPDAIITFVSATNDAGTPIVALEFNNAIPAGNNAWQRFPRIAQATEKKVPFLYIIPVCDAEIKDGLLRSIRHPNTIISLAQLVLMDRFGVPSLTIYEESVWYLQGLVKGLARQDIDGIKARDRIGKFLILRLLEVALNQSSGKRTQLRQWLKQEQEKLFKETLKEMLLMSFYFLETDFTILKGHPLVMEENREDVISSYWERISSGTNIPDKYRFYLWESEQLLKNPLKFGKRVTTNSTFKNNLNVIVSSKCDALSYKKPANEIAFVFNGKAFAEALAQSYPSLDRGIVQQCHNATGPLLFLPIAGYVEDSGGVIAFSRPDKGLVGLMTTVFGNSPTFAERIVLMYHQQIPSSWREELEAAIEEYEERETRLTPNNLWREVARFATIVIVDCFGQGWMRQ